MSATGRNLPGHERHDRDFYETPAWATRLILPHLYPLGVVPKRVIDAGSGTCAISREVRAYWPMAQVLGVELTHGVDFLTLDLDSKVDLVISNPPYKLAMPFVQKALDIGQHVAFLLRLNWLGGVGRHDFHVSHPADVFVLSKRPSFLPGGTTDATEYAWFVWGRARRGGHWSVL